MAQPSRSLAITDPEYYPCSDGAPIGETPLHVRNLFATLHALDVYFKNDPNVFVAANMFVYYVPGSLLRHVTPDVFVVLGVPKHIEPDRKRYLVWDDKPMDCVFEFTSESTRAEDVEDKMAIYRTIGVREYFLFDPYAEYLEPYLQGFRLVEGEWKPIKDVDSRIPSEVLQLHLEPAEDLLRLYDPATRRWLLTPAEERVQLRVAEQQLEVAKQQLNAARREALKEQEREQAARKADEEKKQREEAEREADALRKQLEELQRRINEQTSNGGESSE